MQNKQQSIIHFSLFALSTASTSYTSFIFYMFTFRNKILSLPITPFFYKVFIIHNSFIILVAIDIV